MKITKLALLSIVALGLSACGGDDAPAGPTTGALSVSITDAPITGACEVWVDFTGIDLHGPNGTESFPAEASMDLLSLQGNKSDLLVSFTDLEAGNYQWMRLKINADEGVTDSYIEFRADCDTPESIDNPKIVESLHIPSGAETGLKLNRPFVIAAGSRTDFTIDFDLAKSVHHPQGPDSDYILRPTLRIMNNLEVGTVSGTVSENTLATYECNSANTKVYLFDGIDADVDDIDGVDLDPVTTAFVDVDVTSGAGAYEIGFVEAGSDPYTVALTCDADHDYPGVDNSVENLAALPPIYKVNFVAQKNITVVADTDNQLTEF